MVRSLRSRTTPRSGGLPARLVGALLHRHVDAVEEVQRADHDDQRRQLPPVVVVGGVVALSRFWMPFMASGSTNAGFVMRMVSPLSHLCRSAGQCTDTWRRKDVTGERARGLPG